MNSVDRTLEEMLCHDMADTDVMNSKVTVKVVQMTDSTVEVSDGDKMANVSFDPTANKKYIKALNVGDTCTFFKLGKIDDKTLIFSKCSHCKKEETPSYLKLGLKELIGKQPKELISGQLIVKVWNIGDIITTNTGKKFRKVTMGDNDFTVDLTLWNEKVSVADTLEINHAYSISNFTMDHYPVKSDTEPLNLMFRDKPPVTVMQKALEKDIPVSLKSLECDIKSLIVTGLVDDFDNTYCYKCCPGKNGLKCAKKVTEGQTFCSKPNCRRKLDPEDPVDAYIISLVIFGNDNEIYTVRGFNKTLEHLEIGVGNPQDKLSHLIGKTVTIKARKESDPKSEYDPMLESIIVNE